MRPHVALLHTSPFHVEAFDRLIKAADPGIRVEHIVAEALLADAQRYGANDPALVERVQAAMIAAAANGAALVVCTCSTIGGAAERTQATAGFRVARIDRAMANRAVELGPRVLVVAALESTLEPTTELIQESAAIARTEVALAYLLVGDAWPHFLRGDSSAYIEAVVAAIRMHTKPADVIVLAQASLAPAANALHDLGVPVLASPALGVQNILAHLHANG